MYEKIYKLITDALVDEGFIIISQALPQALIILLYNYSKNATNYKKASISKNIGLHVDGTKRSDQILWLDEDGGVLSEFLAFTTGLQEYLNRSLYLGLSYYEGHFAIYEEGDFYEKHLDAFYGSKNRVLTTVLYLNEEWEASNGGKLIMYNEEDKQIAEVLPSAGTLVIFLSDKFPHEVLPATKKRYSIAGWFSLKKTIF